MGTLLVLFVNFERNVKILTRKAITFGCLYYNYY
jgi:hypothetical protein